MFGFVLLFMGVLFHAVGILTLHTTVFGTPIAHLLFIYYYFLLIIIIIIKAKDILHIEF